MHTNRHDRCYLCAEPEKCPHILWKLGPNTGLTFSLDFAIVVSPNASDPHPLIASPSPGWFFVFEQLFPVHHFSRCLPRELLSREIIVIPNDRSQLLNRNSCKVCTFRKESPEQTIPILNPWFLPRTVGITEKGLNPECSMESVLLTIVECERRDLYL